MEHYLTWNFLIAIYLFMAGLSAGASIIAAAGDIGWRIDEKTKRIAAYLAPFPVMLGLLCLVLDLHRPWNFYQVLIHYHLSSVMSWGAFFLLVFPVIAVIYAAYVYWNRTGIIRKILAWLELILGVAIGIYAGLLLSAIFSNPVWSNPLIAFLFFVSALSTGICMIIIGGKIWDQTEKITLRKFLPASVLPEPRSLNLNHADTRHLFSLDLAVIIIEILVIATLIISYALSPQASVALGAIFTGGYYLLFWIGVVLLGLITPFTMGILELRGILSLRGAEIVAWLEPCLVLLGGFLLRYVIVYGGQIVYPIITYYR